jgi:CelD/BcsL family acetyltransferase involved in cellulose biosynthesis
MPLTFTIERVDSKTGLPAHWLSLYHADHQSSPFNSPMWANNWLRIYGARIQTSVCTWYASGKPVAVCLIAKRSGSWGGIRIKLVGFNTCLDNPEGSPCIEYNDIICLSAYRKLVQEDLPRLNQYIGGSEIRIDGSYEGSLLDSFQPSHCLKHVDVETRIAPYLDMREIKDVSQLINIFSANTRSQIRRSIRELENTGQLQVTPADSPEQAQLFFDGLIALHQEHWQSKNEPGAFNSSHLVEFHRALLQEIMMEKTFRIFRISTDETVIGYLYGFTRFEKFYFYQSGLNYKNNRNTKPGFIAHFALIQFLFAEGIREYDFLAGSSQYKRSLSNKERTLYWRIYRTNSIKMKLLLSIAKFKRHYTNPTSS